MKITNTTFQTINASDITISSNVLKAQIIHELQTGQVSDGIVTPVIDAMNQLLHESNNSLDDIVKSSGLYAFYKYPNPYGVRYIDNQTNQTQKILNYIFTSDSFYDVSIVKYLLVAFDVPYNVANYRTAVNQGLIDADTQHVINHAIELSTNLFDYIKKEMMTNDN